jgi:hypothetical protein
MENGDKYGKARDQSASCNYFLTNWRILKQLSINIPALA